MNDKPMIPNSLRHRVITFEREEIIKEITLTNGNISKTARWLGMTRNGLIKKLRRYSIIAGLYRKEEKK